jgi:hypothetical protein
VFLPLNSSVTAATAQYQLGRLAAGAHRPEAAPKAEDSFRSPEHAPGDTDLEGPASAAAAAPSAAGAAGGKTMGPQSVVEDAAAAAGDGGSEVLRSVREMTAVEQTSAAAATNGRIYRWPSRHDSLRLPVGPSQDLEVPDQAMVGPRVQQQRSQPQPALPTAVSLPDQTQPPPAQPQPPALQLGEQQAQSLQRLTSVTGARKKQPMEAMKKLLREVLQRLKSRVAKSVRFPFEVGGLFCVNSCPCIWTSLSFFEHFSTCIIFCGPGMDCITASVRVSAIACSLS